MKYTIITAINNAGEMTVRSGKNMTIKEAVEIARELRDIGHTDIQSKTGYPIFCPDCHMLVDVDKDLEGFEKYCKFCEIKAMNMIEYHRQADINRSKLAKAYK
jgi:hypothetical protein